MKAAIYTQYGPPEVVHIREVPTPSPKADEVLIRIRATTVNRTDAGIRSAEYFISRFFSGLLRPKDQILGCEFAGEVVEVGREVTTHRVGDRVFGYDDTTFGSHAEYRTMPAAGTLAPIPDGFTYETAAALTEGAHYALGNLRAARVTAGQHVLVYGATGAIGSAAVQLAKHFGATVTAVCHAKNVDLVKSLGADAVIDYTREDFTTRITQPVDLAFDAVGKSSFGACRALLRPKGVYLSTEFGKGGQNVYLALLTPLGGGKRVLFPLPTITPQDVQFLGELAETGRFRPIIDRTYPLEEIVEAYRYVETGQKVGNVVVRV
jgi:NADPH:quinone reductase-like Zn-dependent oxidoreductase